MGPLIKFWIASTLVLLLLALYPALQIQKGGEPAGGDSALAGEARLVDFFCLSRIPVGGKASIPKAWEEVLGAEIHIREAAGEAASDIGFPRERSNEISQLEPGEGLFHADQRGSHYVMKSGQGQNWLVVVSKSSGAVAGIGRAGSTGPSAIAIAVGFAIVGGVLMTLLARVAFGSPTRNP